MPSVRNINKKLRKTFAGKVEAYVENECLVLTGELGHWHEVVSAGMLAAGENPGIGIVNEIVCTGEKPLHTRKPRLEDSHLEWEEPDVLIIGGGVIGCAAARELSRYKLNVLLVEKEHDLAMQATGHCTGLVHSGVKIRRGTLKQWYTKLGNQKLGTVCEELGVPFKRCGQYLIYTNRMWTPLMFLSQLYWRWSGIKGVKRISNEELKALEPGVSGNAGAALYFPSGGVVCPHTLTIALAENSVQNGAYISFNTMVQDIKVEDGMIKSVSTNRGTLQPKVVVNAAGLFCEDIAAMAGDRFYSLHPVKGTSVVLDKKHADSLVRAAVSIQNRASGRKKSSSENISSVLRTTRGSVLAGPVYTETINKEDYSTDRFSFDRTISQLKRTVPALDKNQAVTYYSGIGAATYEGDFIVSAGRNVSNIVHAAGIQFPGLTASPAIAEEITRLVVGMFGGERALAKNPEFNPKRETRHTVKDMDTGMRESLIDENPDYGIIVCHCEQVSMGEVVEALNRNVKCDTNDGVKRRTGACMGTCRGECCSPAILDIISAEKRLALQHIRKSGSGSEIVYGNAAAIIQSRNDSMITDRVDHESDAELKDRLRSIAVSQLQASSDKRKGESQ